MNAPTATKPLVGWNVSVLRGRLSSEPVERDLRSGSRVVSLEVTIAVPDGRDETVPVSWFDPPAGAWSFAAGDDVVVVGRIRRRFFASGGTTSSRTDLAASEVLPARRKRAVERAVATAVRDLDDH